MDDTQPAAAPSAAPLPNAGALATALGRELEERGPHPLGLIERLLELYGEPFVRDHIGRALALESGGGMMLVRTGARRRTLGGVFFWLVRQTLGLSEWRSRVDPDWRPPPKPPGAAAPAPKLARPSPPPRPQPAVRGPKTAQSGEARTVKVTLVGRPAQVEDRGTYIATTMENRKVPDLPKGLPAPPAAPTRYVVFIAKKQWDRVREPLAKDAADMLIVEGFARLDPALGSVVVYATNTTTVAVQRAAKESQRAALAAKTGAS